MLRMNLYIHPKPMVNKLLSTIGLTACLIGFSTSFTATNASPASLFDPVLDDIRRELPDGWQMRLPASLPSDSELYPFISEATNTKLVISLGLTPDCTSATCTIGMIGATDAEATLREWPPAGRSVTPVDLSQGIQGYHLLRGEGDATNQLVMWQQDGLVYGIITLADALSQEQLVAIARSMASESPISR